MIAVRDLRATGFLFDGISVRGAATDVTIENCRMYDNLDDGIGVSSGATKVLVTRCVLERNGFRTKGKGVLVFDYAHAILRDNTIRLNRDGVTVTRGGRAELYGNRIVDNYDKGLGVTGAEVSGADNLIQGNGVEAERGPAPNADGLRVSADSKVTLRDTDIIGNGDAGVVAMGLSRVELVGGTVSDNAGVGVNVRDSAVVELHGVALDDNRAGPFFLDGAGKLKRSSPGDPDHEPHEVREGY